MANIIKIWRVMADAETARSLLSWVLPMIPGMAGTTLNFFTNIRDSPWAIVAIYTIAMFLTVWLGYLVMQKREYYSAKTKGKIASLVFPYVRTVNASPIVDAGNNYLSLIVHFPNALSKHVQMKVTGTLILNGMKSEPFVARDIVIYPLKESSIGDWHVPLQSTMVEFVRQSVRDNNPVIVVLELQDFNDRNIAWITKEWTTLLLTRVS